MVASFPLGVKAGAKPGGTPGAPAGQPDAEGESVLSKILPGGAAEQAGKLTEGKHSPEPGPSCGRDWACGGTPGSVTRAQGRWWFSG